MYTIITGNTNLFFTMHPYLTECLFQVPNSEMKMAVRYVDIVDRAGGARHQVKVFDARRGRRFRLGFRQVPLAFTRNAVLPLLVIFPAT